LQRTSLLTQGTAPATSSAAQPKSLLVFAHPDDEAIALGARLSRFRDAHFVHVTDGAPRNERDSVAHGFGRLNDYRLARREEFRKALACAGIAGASHETLDVADQEASLHLAEIAMRICGFLEQFEPEIVFTHPYEGGHPDHDACAFAVHQAVAVHASRGHKPPAIIEAAFYHAGPGGLVTGTFLRRPERMVEVAYPLSPAEREHKQAVLDCFSTQKQTLSLFRLDAERFRIAPAYEFWRPAHTPPVYYDHQPWGMTSEHFCRLAHQAREALQQEADAACR
jgi:LmbE family N-acetylglucosaminyl deacetylase